MSAIGHYDTFSVFETVHWVDRAEAIVRYLDDEAAMDTTIRSRPETASLPSIQEEEEGVDDNSNTSEDRGVPLSTEKSKGGEIN